MSRCHGVVPQGNTTGRVGAAVTLDFIPRRLTVNNPDNLMFILLFLGKLSLAGGQKEQGGEREENK